VAGVDTAFLDTAYAPYLAVAILLAIVALLAYRASTLDWSGYVPVGEGLALVFSLATIVFPLRIYLWEGPDLFGEHPTLKVLAIAAVGGAGSFSLFVRPGERVLALVPGLVAGLGAAALSMAFSGARLPLEGLRYLGFYPVLGLGTVPGFVLLWLARRVVYRRNHG
jgi:hypothetical protein